jgi:serine/threonine protein kinase
METNNNSNIIISNESHVKIDGDTVKKIYKKDVNEAEFLEKYKSPFFVKLIKKFDGGIEMKYVGEPMGENMRYKDGEYKFHPIMIEKVGSDKLIKWLKDLKAELKRLGVSHGDISPANICYKDGRLTLIDFTFSKEGEYPRGAPRWEAPYNDEEYIDILIKQLNE